MNRFLQNMGWYNRCCAVNRETGACSYDIETILVPYHQLSKTYFSANHVAPPRYDIP